MARLLDEALAAIERGWALTPLRGKVPQLRAWTGQPKPDEADVRRWVADGLNLGLRTGPISGVLVVDRDRLAAQLDLPRTPTVETPGDGQHFYFIYPPGPDIGNSASKLAPHVDIRGDGGQVVFPGSTHPNGGTYRWSVSPSEAPLAPPPEWVLKKLRTVTLAPEPIPTDSYARAALVREAARVRCAPEGKRNDTLNTAAFSLGQLVAGGELDEPEVRAELEAAAILAGLPEREATRTISSGLAAGLQRPRRAKSSSTVVRVQSAPKRVEDVVLIPGSHTLPTGEYVEVSPADFAHSTFTALPPDVIYRRGGVPGEIVDHKFRELTQHRARLLASQHIRFGAGVAPKKDEDEPTIVFRSISQDHGNLLSAGAASHPRVRSLDLLTPYPVLLRDWTVSPPGWADGVYYTGTEAPEPERDVDTIRAVLADLVVDFPFASDADRENFYGLLLTPLIRHAIGGPAPLHIIESGMERTGKTKLAETVFGGTILGAPTPVFQLGRYEEEREKRIFAILLAGETISLLDNLSDRIDSPALASLLTANVYRGRTLGRSHVAALPNLLTVVATANHPQASPEIAKRVVPISLETPPNPESRTDFRHPDLRRYVASQRGAVLACLLGMVANWRSEGSPSGSVAFGGFEEWSDTVGGVLALHGFSGWLTNAQDWRGSSDELSPQIDALVAAWAGTMRTRMSAAELFDLAVKEGLFPECTDRDSRAAAMTSLAKLVLSKLPGRPSGDHRIRTSRCKGAKVYRLERLT